MPSIVPSGPSQDVFLVLDQFGERLGRAWRETDENDTDYETLIRHLLEGQCNNPVRVVAFNTDEGWSRDVSDDVADELQERWDYIYEPDAGAILDSILMRYIEAQIFQGAVENVACEMAARMVAMKSASDNAGKLIDELQLIYNKARQAAITKELSEIVGGAAAV